MQIPGETHSRESTESLVLTHTRITFDGETAIDGITVVIGIVQTLYKRNLTAFAIAGTNISYDLTDNWVGQVDGGIAIGH